MKTRELYDIPFVGLKLGKHAFHYNIDKAFFEMFESAPIDNAEVQVNLEFIKKENIFDLGFNLSGWVNVECDRCAENFDLDIEDRFQVFAKYKSERMTEKNENDPDVVFISRNDTHINVADLIYEFAVLSIPMHKTHPDDENGTPLCNPDILDRLHGGEKEDEVDPRWSALSKLKKQKT